MNIHPNKPEQKQPKTGKLFKNGRSQAVRIPAEYRFDGTEVEFRPGPLPGEVTLSPKRKRPEPTGNWDAFFKSRAEIPPEELEGFMEDREQDGQIRDDPFE
ncbi:MAG: AbrB/MazE/SpoVT family DNA-binding domain-containing protein [Rhizobiaceae bacterium]|jgi:antitoxin VapB|nr:AbrB/MazE/SpoVT family DNA-binding domain-containing protein [Rhizobiaceae bacterium]